MLIISVWKQGTAIIIVFMNFTTELYIRLLNYKWEEKKYFTNVNNKRANAFFMSPPYST